MISHGCLVHARGRGDPRVARQVRHLVGERGRSCRRAAAGGRRSSSRCGPRSRPWTRTGPRPSSSLPGLLGDPRGKAATALPRPCQGWGRRAVLLRRVLLCGRLRRVGRRARRLRRLRRRRNGGVGSPTAAGEHEQSEPKTATTPTIASSTGLGTVGDHGVKVPQPAAAALELNLPKQVGVHRTRKRSTLACPIRTPYSSVLAQTLSGNPGVQARRLHKVTTTKPFSSAGKMDKPLETERVRAGVRTAGGGGASTLIPSSLSCSLVDPAPGRPVSGSCPVAVFGNAITSLIDYRPASSAAIRSSPDAMPPCGGAPCSQRLDQEAELLIGRLNWPMPSVSSTRYWTSGRLMRMLPPPSSYAVQHHVIGPRPCRSPGSPPAAPSDSSVGDVNGWWSESQRPSSSFHSTSGKSVTHSGRHSTFWDQAEAPAQLQAQRSQCLGGDAGIVGHQEQQVRGARPPGRTSIARRPAFGEELLRPETASRRPPRRTPRRGRPPPGPGRTRSACRARPATARGPRR